MSLILGVLGGLLAGIIATFVFFDWLLFGWR